MFMKSLLTGFLKIHEDESKLFKTRYDSGHAKNICKIYNFGQMMH